jgi:pyridoxine kinase
MKQILSIQSHVVYGHAGNSAAVFPMQRMGANVWPLHTVQFSNHTQYGKWTGMVIPPEQISQIPLGIAAIEQLGSCDAVLSGYIGSAEQGEHILSAVRQVKAANPNALYHCDPVMSHPLKGCIVAPGVAEFLVEKAMLAADVVSPNQNELEMIVGRTFHDLADIIAGAKAVVAKGPKIVLVKHLTYQAKQAGQFEMLVVSQDESYWITRPLFEFVKEPVGVGDMTSGLFLTALLQGQSLKKAFEHAASAVYGVLKNTENAKHYELAVIASQEEYVKPSTYFEALAV